ncbi:MAG: ion channel [Candidatus Hydrogenedentota bacterium]
MGFFLLFYVYMTLSVLRHVLREDEVDADTIAGSICIYLLLGVIWAMMFAFVEEMESGSFQLAFQDGALSADGATPHFTFFLYTTLTTLGYGDILPMTPSSRSLTTLEVIAGVFHRRVRRPSNIRLRSQKVEIVVESCLLLADFTSRFGLLRHKPSPFRSYLQAMET